MSKKYFTEENLKLIEENVKQVESQSGIEVVPVFVERSHNYPQAFWRLVVFSLAVLLLTFEIIQVSTSNTWDENHKLFLNINIILGIEFIFIFVIAKIFNLSKYFLHEEEINRETFRCAQTDFLKYEVFKTKNRIGVLIHLSFLERKINILADSGIFSKTKQEDWDAIAQYISQEFKKGHSTQALIRAIEMCGELAKKVGIEPELSHSNELDDKLR